MKKKLITIGIIFVFLTIFFSGCNESTRDSDINAGEIVIKPENISLFYCKKVIIRDDDIGSSSYLQSFKWIADLAVSKDFKVTFAIIPKTLVNNLETIEYLNHLDQNRFEFATHGYEHILFKGLSFEKQYSLIENGTRIIEDCLSYKPFTFIPPYGASDTNTTIALRNLGYHSITDMRGFPCYVKDFVTDFGYETEWHSVRHRSFDEFKNSFDTFCYSSDEYYIIVLHDWTFLDDTEKLNETRTDAFEILIDYIKNKNVQFMKIEEAYRRMKDENKIKTGIIDKNIYYIDLKESLYNHTIKISPLSSWDGDIYIKNNETGQEIILDKEKLEFNAIKGHLYYILNRKL